MSRPDRDFSGEECCRILGVGRDAGWRQVKRAYRRLAMRYHPDRRHFLPTGLTEVECRQRFAEVTRAYAALERRFAAAAVREEFGICARCGDMETLRVGLDGNGYCRTCLIFAEGKRALPAPPTVVVSCAVTAAGLAASAVCLAAWLNSGWGTWWWLSLGLCIVSMIALATTCLIIQYTVR